MTAYENSGLEVFAFLAFVGICVVIGASLHQVLRGTLAGRYLRSLTLYPPLTLLSLLATLAGTGYLLNGLGLRHWLYPDQLLPRLCAAAFLVVLYAQVLALSYLRDQELYESGQPGHPPTRRTDRILGDTAAALTHGSWRPLAALLEWAAGLTFAPSPSDADPPVRTTLAPLPLVDPGEEEGNEDGAVKVAAARGARDRRRRLAATLAVVLVHTWRVWPVIAIITLFVVIYENYSSVASGADRGRILGHYLTYVAGLPLGWLLAAVPLYVLGYLLPARLWRPPHEVPDVGRDHADGRGRHASAWNTRVALLAAPYLGSILLWPRLLPFWLLVLILGAVAAGWRLRGRWGQVLKHLRESLRRPGVYVASLIVCFALPSLFVFATRALGADGSGGPAWSEGLVWLVALVPSLFVTCWFLRATRLDRSRSLVALPALILQVFFLACTGYHFSTGSSGSAPPWVFRNVVALPLTSLFGATFALYFLIAILLPRHRALGLLACVALFAYMDGMAIDLSQSDLKLNYSYLKDYNSRPVRLDSRDYLLSSYGRVVPVEWWDARRPPASTRIGGGRFRIAGDDLLVCLPDGYLPGERAWRAGYHVVMRMPIKVTLIKQPGPKGVKLILPRELPPEASGRAPREITWENLQNGALLWAHPPNRSPGQYAIFPLRAAWEEAPAQSPVPDWVYSEARDGGKPVWQIEPREAVSVGRLDVGQLYLIGNWPFPIDEAIPLRPNQPQKDDAKYQLRWYRVPGGAGPPYFPKLWRPEERGAAFRGFRSFEEGKAFFRGLWGPEEENALQPNDAQDAEQRCLNLVRPQLGEASSLVDLEVTLGTPHPWGKYQTLRFAPGQDGVPERWRLLITMANRWVAPLEGDQVTFARGGEIPYGVIYKVVSVTRPSSSRGGPGLPSFRDLRGEERLRSLVEPPAPGSPERRSVAAVVEIEPVSNPGERSPTKGDGPAAGRAPLGDGTLDVASLSRPIPEANSWKLVPPEPDWDKDEESVPLLDQVEVLRRWKRQLDDLREQADASWKPTDTSDRNPLKCPCPQVHDPDNGKCPRGREGAPPNAECQCEVRHKLVLVTTNGGGIRSALWAVTVLGYLERQFGPSFPYHVRIITGASGGMVGATYYAGSLLKPGVLTARFEADRSVFAHEASSPLDLARNLGASDFLSAAASHMVFSDTPRLVALPFSLRRDRGEALQDAWKGMWGAARPEFSAEAGRAFSAKFKALARREFNGEMPSLVFTPMIVEDGRRLLVSNLDFNFAPRNIGSMLLEPNSSLMRPQLSQFGSLLPRAISPGQDLYSLTAIEFFRVFPAARDLPVAVAARMSATFPLISPAVTLPTIPPRSVVDAGYYDNFGVNLVALWTNVGDVRNWLADNTSGVVIIQIRDHASQVLRTELDHDIRQPHGGLAGLLHSARLAAATGDAVGAVSARGFLQLTRPLTGFWNSRYAVTSFRNDEQIEDLSNWLGAVPPTNADLRKALRKQIGGSLEALVNPMAIAEKFKYDRVGLPYTTVVFECPVEAALSWDLSNFEAENIRKGMGPEFDEGENRARRPLDLVRSPLNEANRFAFVNRITEEFTKPEHKKYGVLRGDQLWFVVTGVSHNLQRLWLLEEWWKNAKPKLPGT